MRFPALALAALTLVLSGCPKNKTDDSLTASEAQQALEESTVASQAENLTSASIEITTNFTIGQAVEQAAQQIHDFIVSQLPCADVQLSGATLSVTYGAKPGNCTYNGHTFSGKTSVTVSKNDQNQVEVHHTWTDLTNGRVTLNGEATVTWDFQAKSRHVVHTATWKRNSDGFTVTGEGDRNQTVLSGGIVEGIQIDGSRSWKSVRGQWDLAIDGVQMRWVDPVPQAGSYTLHTPKNKTLSLSFARVDADTIKVTIANGSHSFSFNVTKAGSASSA